MKKKDYNNLSNAEIRIKMKELEDEFEATKIKIKTLLEKLGILDEKYLEAKSVLEKRTKGKI